MTSYPIEVFWSAEDQTWVADVPDLPFCTAHGPSHMRRWQRWNWPLRHG